jgi:hypothetical protein
MQKLFNTAVFVFVLIFAAYLAVQLIPVQLWTTTDRAQIISDSIQTVAKEAWAFFRPFAQLTIILWILQLVLDRTGIKLDLKSLSLAWDIRSLIAILVVVTFCIAALANIGSSSTLKDVALVVIGFYFGGLTNKAEEQASKSVNTTQ